MILSIFLRPLVTWCTLGSTSERLNLPEIENSRLTALKRTACFDISESSATSDKIASGGSVFLPTKKYARGQRCLTRWRSKKDVDRLEVEPCVYGRFMVCYFVLLAKRCLTFSFFELFPQDTLISDRAPGSSTTLLFACITEAPGGKAT